MKKVLCIILVLSTLLIICSCQATNQKGSKEYYENLFKTKGEASTCYDKLKEEDIVMIENQNCTYGYDLWKEFYNKVDNKKEATMLCVIKYELKKEHVADEVYESLKNNYPILYLYLVEYDGENFNLKIRNCTNSEIESQDTYKYLLRFEGNYPAYTNNATYEKYVLVDDPTLTWEGYTTSVLSSTFTDHQIYNKFKVVFENDT